MGGGNLRQANLEETNLRVADLQNADLREASLQGADLWEANLRGVNWAKANLEGVKRISIDQLSRVETLFEARLDRELTEQIAKEHPRLLEHPED